VENRLSRIDAETSYNITIITKQMIDMNKNLLKIVAELSKNNEILSKNNEDKVDE
jgi:uncharacterized protein (DUF2344 family)